MKPSQIVFTTVWFVLLASAWWINVFGVPSRTTMMESVPKVIATATPEPEGLSIHDNVIMGTPSYYFGTPMVMSTPVAIATMGPSAAYVYICPNCSDQPAPAPKPQETDNTLVIPRVLP